MTNYEKIKAMSVEEMAKSFEKNKTCDFCIYRPLDCYLYGPYACSAGIRKYLESEVEK